MTIDIGIDKPYKIFTDFVEEGALEQFKDVMSQDWVLRGALLPDVHKGYSLCIGGVVETKGMISPSFVGVN
ncbi:RtcB family protein [bacterium]|nr:RtcB family protein [bacterium]